MSREAAQAEEILLRIDDAMEKLAEARQTLANALKAHASGSQDVKLVSAVFHAVKGVDIALSEVLAD